MTTQLARRRGGRGLYARKALVQQDFGENGQSSTQVELSPESASRDALRKPQRIPEFLTPAEVRALINVAQPPQARLAFLVGFRAGLRVSEIVGLTVPDLYLAGDRPYLRVRWQTAKMSKERIVPLHPELVAALENVLAFRPRYIAKPTSGRVGGNAITAQPRTSEVGKIARLLPYSRATIWRWIKDAHAKAVELGAIAPGKQVGVHTLRHSAARHWLEDGVPLPYIQQWLGHSSISVTMIYLATLPDPGRFMERVT